jgi:hypothetical protein
MIIKNKYQNLDCQDKSDILPTLEVKLPELKSDGSLIISKKLSLEINNFLTMTKSKPGYKNEVLVKTPATTHGSVYRTKLKGKL